MNDAVIQIPCQFNFNKSAAIPSLHKEEDVLMLLDPVGRKMVIVHVSYDHIMVKDGNSNNTNGKKA